jgi:hypothetical protein
VAEAIERLFKPSSGEQIKTLSRGGEKVALVELRNDGCHAGC